MCFLTLTEKNLSKRTIFAYLDDVKNTFLNYLQNEHKDELDLGWGNQPQVENGHRDNGPSVRLRPLRYCLCSDDIQTRRSSRSGVSTTTSRAI